MNGPDVRAWWTGWCTPRDPMQGAGRVATPGSRPRSESAGASFPGKATRTAGPALAPGWAEPGSIDPFPGAAGGALGLRGPRCTSGPSLRPAGPVPRYPAPDPGRRRPGSPAPGRGNRDRVPRALIGPVLGAVDGGSSYVAIRPGAVAIITGWLRCAGRRPDYIVTGPGRRAGGAPEQPDELSSRC